MCRKVARHEECYFLTLPSGLLMAMIETNNIYVRGFMNRARRFSREIAIALVLSLAAVIFLFATGFREGENYASADQKHDALHLTPVSAQPPPPSSN
jgi:hypothetical protein